MPELNSDPDIHTVSDATLTQLQLALREQQVILDTAGVGIVFVKNRLVIRCNQRLAQMYGFNEVSDIVGNANLTLYPDQSVFDALEDAALLVMTHGLVYKTELQMARQDGQLFWAHLTGQLVNPQDIEECSICIVDDISEQNLAQAQLESVFAEKRLIL